MPSRWEGQEQLISIANNSLIPQCNEFLNLTLPTLREQGVCHPLSSLWLASFSNTGPAIFLNAIGSLNDANTSLEMVSEILKKIMQPMLQEVALDYSPSQEATESELKALLQKNLNNQAGVLISIPLHTQAIYFQNNEFIVFDPNEIDFTDNELKRGGKIFPTLEDATQYLYERFRLIHSQFHFTIATAKQITQNFPLHQAIVFGDTGTFLNSLNEESVNSIDFNGMTALHLAVMYDKSDYVELLLQRGADKNQCVHEDTPLMLAATLVGKLITNNGKIINLLAENEPEVTLGKALHIALDNKNYVGACVLVNKLNEMKSGLVAEILIDFYLSNPEENNLELDNLFIKTLHTIHKGMQAENPNSVLQYNNLIQSKNSEGKLQIAKVLLEEIFQSKDLVENHNALIPMAFNLLQSTLKEGNKESLEEVLYYAALFHANSNDSTSLWGIKELLIDTKQMLKKTHPVSESALLSQSLFRPVKQEEDQGILEEIQNLEDKIDLKLEEINKLATPS